MRCSRASSPSFWSTPIGRSQATSRRNTEDRSPARRPPTRPVPPAEPRQRRRRVARVHGRHRRRGPRPRVFMKPYRGVPDTPVSLANCGLGDAFSGKRPMSSSRPSRHETPASPSGNRPSVPRPWTRRGPRACARRSGRARLRRTARRAWSLTFVWMSLLALDPEVLLERHEGDAGLR